MPAIRTPVHPIAASLIGLAVLAACTATDVAGTLSAAKDKAVTPTPAGQSGTKTSGTDFSGGVDTSGKTPTPAPTGESTSATAAPTPTPTPPRTPSPTAIPYTAFAAEVTVNPATASINLKDPENIGGANYPTSVVLSADVLLSDTSHSTQVDWSSSDEQVATVSQAGVVSSATKKGTVTITAKSKDGLAVGTCTVTVKDDSALDVTIN